MQTQYLLSITKIGFAPFLKILLKNGVFRIKKRENGTKNSEKMHMDSLTNAKTFFL